MKTSIFDTLKHLNLTSIETRKLFNNRTRDVDDLKVWKDEVSGVIYTDDFYTGDETYVDGSYRGMDFPDFTRHLLAWKNSLLQTALEKHLPCDYVV